MSATPLPGTATWITGDSAIRHAPMVTRRDAMGSMKLRPLALPFEHGAWGFLLEPVAVGMLVAPSMAGLLIAIGVIAAFLARHPLRLATRDLVQHKGYPRTTVCLLLALGYASVAAAAFTAAMVLAGGASLLPLIAAIPLVATQFVLDVRNHGRALPAELAGAIAAGATATATLIAATQPPALALALWALLAARAIASILYVRCSLRSEPRAIMLAVHAAAVVLAIALRPVVSLGAVAAMLVLFARAVPVPASSARQIGMRELGYGAIVVLLIALV